MSGVIQGLSRAEFGTIVNGMEALKLFVIAFWKTWNWSSIEDSVSMIESKSRFSIELIKESTNRLLMSKTFLKMVNDCENFEQQFIETLTELWSEFEIGGPTEKVVDGTRLSETKILSRQDSPQVRKRIILERPKAEQMESVLN